MVAHDLLISPLSLCTSGMICSCSSFICAPVNFNAVSRCSSALSAAWSCFSAPIRAITSSFSSASVKSRCSLISYNRTEDYHIQSLRESRHPLLLFVSAVVIKKWHSWVTRQNSLRSSCMGQLTCLQNNWDHRWNSIAFQRILLWLAECDNQLLLHISENDSTTGSRDFAHSCELLKAVKTYLIDVKFQWIRGETLKQYNNCRHRCSSLEYFLNWKTSVVGMKSNGYKDRQNNQRQYFHWEPLQVVLRIMLYLR